MHDSVLERVTLRRSLGAKYLTTPAPLKKTMPKPSHGPLQRLITAI